MEKGDVMKVFGECKGEWIEVMPIVKTNEKDLRLEFKKDTGFYPGEEHGDNYKGVQPPFNTGYKDYIIWLEDYVLRLKNNNDYET